jgi:hypothetical protein
LVGAPLIELLNLDEVGRASLLQHLQEALHARGLRDGFGDLVPVWKGETPGAVEYPNCGNYLISPAIRTFVPH